MEDIKILEEMYQKSQLESKILNYLNNISELARLVAGLDGDFLVYGDTYFIITEPYNLQELAKHGVPLTIHLNNGQTIKFWSRKDINKIHKYLVEVEKWKQVF